MNNKTLTGMLAKNLAEKDGKTLTRKIAKDPAKKKLAKDHTAKKFTKTLAEKLDKDLTGKEVTKTLAEKIAKDLNARKFTKTLARKLAKAYIKTLTGRFAKNLAEEDIGGSYSYPLVDPR